jgi:predicted O-methyltransferase YrrM
MDFVAKSPCGEAHGPNWMMWCGHLRGQPVNGLEIGTFQGDSAEFFLTNVFDHPEARYYCIDPFTGSAEHAMLKIDCTKNEEITREKLSGHGTRAQIMVGKSNSWLPTLKHAGVRVQMAYIDGAHDSANVLRDAILAFELLVVDGVLIFDDVPWDTMPEPFDNPRSGIAAFLMGYAKHINIIAEGYQLALAKISEVP